MTLHIIADDLTGACDTGAVFAQRGLSTAVVIGNAEAVVAVPDVLVQTTESRHLPTIAATARVAATGRLIATGYAWVYKKIDSTMRGHPGAELAALMDALGESRALVAPALPAQGRTVSAGQLLVRGIPLEQTDFASEGVRGEVEVAMQQSQYQTRLVPLTDVRAGAAHLCEILSPTKPQLFIADAETDDDLQALVQAAGASGIRVLCGSAGLATALAAHVMPVAKNTSPASHDSGPMLVVAGSRNPTTSRQVERAKQSGISCVRPAIEFINHDDPAHVAAVTHDVVTCLKLHGRALLSTCDLPESPLGRRAIAERLGAVVALVTQQITLGGLVLTGGDVAAATCSALGVHLLWLHSETQPGIALGHVLLPDDTPLTVITKAGGFGDQDALLNAISNLQINS